MVKFVSEFFGLGLYESIRFYSITVSEAGAGRYEGFSISFFGYTILWPLVFFFLASSTRLLSELEKSRWFVIVKVYMILCFPYFVFGFGPFSNRYAFIAWLFVPVFQSCVAASLLNLNRMLSVLSSMILFFMSFLFYLFLRLEFLV